jgi:hypothetical protein
MGHYLTVIGTKNQTGAWDGAGQTREVFLSDGSSSKEMISKYKHPYYFSYKVNEIQRHAKFTR